MRLLSVFATALVFAGPIVAGAQDESSSETSREPRPALMAYRAATSLLLDITRAGDHWVVVGQRGDILLSNNGEQWQQVHSPVNATLTRVRFIDNKRGWAAGYDGTLLGTDDGGSTWTLLQFDPDWAKPYFDLLFFDENNGLLAGANGALSSSSDGGRTWQSVDTDVLEDGPNLYNLIRLGDDSLLLAGERGFLARSTDHGSTWQRLHSPYTGSFFGALPYGDNGVVVFGLRGNAFYAADIAAAEPLSAEMLEKLQEAALDPDATDADPVSEVAGWTQLKSTEFESLFGGTVAAGRVVLFGMNGHVMLADLEEGRLDRMPMTPENNMNAGVVSIKDNAMIVVGTAGVQRLPLMP